MHLPGAVGSVPVQLPCYVRGVRRECPDRYTVQTNVPALRTVYAKDFTIGCLLSYRNIGFASDPPVPGQSPVATPPGGYLIKFHMNRMSPGTT